VNESGPSASAITDAPVRQSALTERARAPLEHRVIAGVVGCALLAVLIIASRLTPAAEGVGTHRGLGLPACGMLVASGVPCPTCGMTTAFAHMTGLEVIAAFRAQPFGAALALGSAAGFWLCVWIAGFGSRIGTLLVRMLSPRVVWLVFVLAGAAWVYKIAANG
jgi:Protein of unknown function (DUF2752)